MVLKVWSLSRALQVQSYFYSNTIFFTLILLQVYKEFSRDYMMFCDVTVLTGYRMYEKELRPAVLS